MSREELGEEVQVEGTVVKFPKAVMGLACVEGKRGSGGK